MRAGSVPDAAGPRPSRRTVLRAGAVVVGTVGTVAAVGAGGLALASRDPGRPVATDWDSPHPVFGLLQVTREQTSGLLERGVSAVTLSVAWDRAEPERGRMDADYLDEVRERHRAARKSGLLVVLIPGLQYPPAWVFELSDSTRFVDQHGSRWFGETGDDIADGVFDDLVRQAQEDYLRRLGEELSSSELAAVRVGGLGRGELRYPVVHRDGTRDTLWCYSRAAQAACPVPGVRPGEGRISELRSLVDWYLGSLADYGRWQLDTLREAFGPGPRLLVLLPSWGLRPGEVERAVASGLDGSTSGQMRGTLTEGLDWDRQLTAYAEVPGVAVCTTWLDPPDQGKDADRVSPGRYLAALAAPLMLEVWGENTGGNDRADMSRCIRLVDELGMAGLFWMSGSDLGEDGNATLDDYAELIAAR
jgi:hypothetical protein